MASNDDRDEPGNTGNHHRNRSNRKRKYNYKNNEFQSQEDSHGSESIIDPTPSSSNDVVLVPSLATLLPPEDARLLSKFSATHEGFLLSEETHPPIIRRLAYENFTSFLKFLNSHTTLALLTTLRASVCDQLEVLRYSGFKGEWFDLLVRRLDHHHYPYIAEEDLKELTQLEAVYSQQTDALLKEIQVLSRKLHELNGKYFAGKEALEHIFHKKQQIMKDRKSLDIPFTF